MTKYNKAEIMRRAHSIRREGKSMSQAMRTAWAEAKISRLDEQLFSLNMKDRWSTEDHDLYRRLSTERSSLVASAGIIEKARTASRPAESKTENPSLTKEEKRRITDEMFRMMTAGIYDGSFSMDAYKALEARLYVA